MKKVLQCFGIAVYGTITAFLLWMLYFWATPYVMNIGWLLFILYLIFAFGFLTALSGFVNTLLMVPMAFLVKNNVVAKIINALPMLWFGYRSMLLPWGLNMDYGTLQYLLGISLSSKFVISFISLIIIPFRLKDQ